jgi:hypothetical protein
MAHYFRDGAVTVNDYRNPRIFRVHLLRPSNVLTVSPMWKTALLGRFRNLAIG